jgi:hypothetical protein
MVTKCSNQVLYVWLVLNSGCKREFLQIKILLYIGLTWSIDELKMRLVTWLIWNAVNGKSLFHLPYLITLMAFLCTQRTPKEQIKYFCLNGRSRDHLWQIGAGNVTPNNDIRICLLFMMHNWTKNAFLDVYNTKWPKWVKFISSSLFNTTYGLPVLTKGTNIPNQVIYVSFVDLQTICAK